MTLKIIFIYVLIILILFSGTNDDLIIIWLFWLKNLYHHLSTEKKLYLIKKELDFLFDEYFAILLQLYYDNNDKYVI